MARKQQSIATASAAELGAASEGQAAQMEATASVGTSGPDAWPINWNGIVLGTLAVLAALLVFGLTGIALRAHDVGQNRAVDDFHKLGLGSLFFSIFGTFLSFALGGWIAGQIAGFRRAEPCMLHGACAFLLTIPVLLSLAGMGAAGMYGGWLSGLDQGHPGWSSRAVDGGGNSVGSGRVDSDGSGSARTASDVDVARRARNTALGTVAALLIGLMGAVIGGWMSSGEPMTFSYYKTRDLGLGSR